MLERFVENEYKRGKHDSIVKSLENRLINSGLYTEIKHSAEYNTYPYINTYGETDIIAYVDNRLFLFEVKSTRNYKTRKRAKYQLNRTEKFVNEELGRGYNFYKFYVSGIPNDRKGIKYNIERILDDKLRKYN